MYIYLYKYI